jgi:hypothetical protein
MNSGENLGSALLSSRYFIFLISLLMGLIVSDIYLVRINDIISTYPFLDNNAREIVFGIISVGCLTAQFFLLKLLNPIHMEQGRANSQTSMNYRPIANPIYKLTRLVWYAIAIVVLLLVLQIMLVSYYSTSLLSAIIIISYSLSIGILSLFVIKMFSVLISRRSVFVTSLFVIAITSVTINAAVSMIDSCLRLGDRPPETRVYIGGSGDVSKGRYDILDNIYFISFIISFATAWIATAQLLKYYARRIGKIKYYSIIVCPLIFFIAQFGVPLLKSISPVFDLDPFTVLSYALVLSTLSKPIGGLMLGICFWSMASVLTKKSTVRNYLIISGFGFLLLFTSNQAILMSIAPYPPFGISTITVMGISAYMIVLGIYSSTISISNDSELRKSIRRFVRSQSHPLELIASAEAEKEIESRVIYILRKKSAELELTTGVSPSLSEDELKTYLKEVLKETGRHQ